MSRIREEQKSERPRAERGERGRSCGTLGHTEVLAFILREIGSLEGSKQRRDRSRLGYPLVALVRTGWGKAKAGSHSGAHWCPLVSAARRTDYRDNIGSQGPGRSVVLVQEE